MPVLATGLKDSKAGKALDKIRRITRALGAVRELDVTMMLLDDLATRDGIPRPALEEVRGYVMKKQEARRRVMLKRLGRVNVEKLDRRLASLGGELQEAQTDEWRRSLASRLLKRSKVLHTAVDQAGHMYEAERLHQVRIAAKKMRYATEVAAETGVRAARKPVITIKRAQETLGRLHDLQVLQSYVAVVQALPRRSSSIDGGLDAITRLLEDECRHLHAKYVAGIPELQTVVNDIRTVVAPQVARRRARRRALKMKLSPRSGRTSSGRAVAASSHR